MTMVMDDVVSARSAARAADLSAPAGHVRARRRRAAYDADGREYLDLLSGIGVASLGHAHPGLARAIADQAQTLIHTSNLFYHPLQGQLAERLAQSVGTAARVLLQQRHGSGGSVPEVRAPLLVHARASRAPEIIALEESFHGRTFGALSVTSDEHYRDAVRAAAAGRHVRADQRPGGAAAAVIDEHRGDHRRAGARRRRHPAADAGVRGGDHRSVRANRRAAHRRRSPERPRPDRLSVLLQGARPASRTWCRSARRSAAACRSARRSSARRSRTTISFGDHGRPTAATCSPAARRCASSTSSSDGGLLAHDRPRRPPFRTAAARDRRGRHADREGGARRGLMWGLELTRDAAPVVPAGARARRGRQPHRGNGRAAAAAARHH